MPFTRSERSAPLKIVAAAKMRRDETGQQLLFFADPTSGRVRLLYGRYDVHYGLVRPFA